MVAAIKAGLQVLGLRFHKLTPKYRNTKFWVSFSGKLQRTGFARWDQNRIKTRIKTG
jgi:hypothetical protein